MTVQHSANSNDNMTHRTASLASDVAPSSVDDVKLTASGTSVTQHHQSTPLPVLTLQQTA